MKRVSLSLIIGAALLGLGGAMLHNHAVRMTLEGELASELATCEADGLRECHVEYQTIMGVLVSGEVIGTR